MGSCVSLGRHVCVCVCVCVLFFVSFASDPKLKWLLVFYCVLNLCYLLDQVSSLKERPFIPTESLFSQPALFRSDRANGSNFKEPR